MNYITLVCMFICCLIVSVHGQDIEKDSVARQYFSEQEITQIDDLLLSFEAQIGQITDRQGDERYRSYLRMDSMHIAGKADYNSYRIPTKEAQRILYALDTALFNKMFAYSYQIDKDSKQPTAQYISPRVDGAYVKLGKEVGKENEFWKYYFDAVSNAGDISPSVLATLPKVALQHIDLNKERDRLFVALHYLLSMAPKEDV